MDRRPGPVRLVVISCKMGFAGPVCLPEVVMHGGALLVVLVTFLEDKRAEVATPATIQRPIPICSQPGGS